MSEEEKGEAIIVTETAAPAPSTGIVPGKIRYPALICSCLLAFGGYLVFDLCATLQVSTTSLLSPPFTGLRIASFRMN